MGPQPRCEEPVYRRWQHLCNFGRREPDAHNPGAGALRRRSDEAALGQLVRLRCVMSGDNPLTPAQSDDLRAIAAVMIPASVEFDVPGADDPAIQADIMATPRPRRPPCAGSAGRACTPCRVAAGQSRPDTSGGCGDGTARKRRGRGGDADPGRPAQCYYRDYRDDRVVRSLGLEPRPPYPKGHEFG